MHHCRDREDRRTASVISVGWMRDVTIRFRGNPITPPMQVTRPWYFFSGWMTSANVHAGPFFSRTSSFPFLPLSPHITRDRFSCAIAAAIAAAEKFLDHPLDSTSFCFLPEQARRSASVSVLLSTPIFPLPPLLSYSSPLYPASEITSFQDLSTCWRRAVRF